MALLVHVLAVLCVAVLFTSGQSDSALCDKWCKHPASREVVCCKDVGGTCKVDGDSHIQTFEKSLSSATTSSPTVSKYLFRGTGEYIITQHGFSSPALFGVNANFEYCNYLKKHNLSGVCLDKTSYYEPGIVVTLELPPAKQAAKCVTRDGTPRDRPYCDIKVLVNGESIDLDGSSVKEVFRGDGGPILVIRHTGIGGAKNVNCIAIVGTKGISVSLCEHYKNYPFLNIWAKPSLKADPSDLHGLCNTFTKTGDNSTDFVLKNNTKVSSEECLTYTAKEGNAWEICDTFSQSWMLPTPKYNNVLHKLLIDFVQKNLK